MKRNPVFLVLSLTLLASGIARGEDSDPKTDREGVAEATSALDQARAARRETQPTSGPRLPLPSPTPPPPLRLEFPSTASAFSLGGAHSSAGGPWPTLLVQIMNTYRAPAELSRAPDGRSESWRRVDGMQYAWEVAPGGGSLVIRSFRGTERASAEKAATDAGFLGVSVRKSHPLRREHEANAQAGISYSIARPTVLVRMSATGEAGAMRSSIRGGEAKERLDLHLRLQAEVDKCVALDKKRSYEACIAIFAAAAAGYPYLEGTLGASARLQAHVSERKLVYLKADAQETREHVLPSGTGNSLTTAGAAVGAAF